MDYILWLLIFFNITFATFLFHDLYKSLTKKPIHKMLEEIELCVKYVNKKGMDKQKIKTRFNELMVQLYGIMEKA